MLSEAGRELKDARAELVDAVATLSEDNARLKSDLAEVGTPATLHRFSGLINFWFSRAG